MGIAIVITSGKGGTGKTSVTAGVGSCLAAMGHPVLCLDLDVGLRNLDLSLGMTDRAIMDFTDVIEGRCTLERAAVEHPVIRNLRLLTAPLSPVSITAEQLTQLVHEIKKRCDYCLIDCPAGLGSGFQLSVSAADRAIVVTTTDPAALRDAQSTVARIRTRNIPTQLIVNRVSKKLLRKLHATIDDAMDAAGLPLLGVIPEDECVPLCAGLGKSVITAENRGAARAYYRIAQRVTGKRVPFTRL